MRLSMGQLHSRRNHRIALRLALCRSVMAFSVARAMALAPASVSAQGALPKSVNVGTNPSGTLFYSLASGVAATIAAHAPFKAETAPYSGTSTFLPLLNEGRELDFGVVNAVDMGRAYRGPDKLKVDGLMRVWYATAGLFMLVPLGAFAGARVINVIGICLAVALLALNRLAKRRASVA